MNVCQRNVASFGHVECRFDKINDIYQGLGSLVSLRLQKDGGAKRKQIWTNLSHWNTGGSSYHCEELLFFNLYLNVQLVKHDIVTAIIYYYIMTRVSLRETWLSVWRCYVWRKTLIPGHLPRNCLNVLEAQECHFPHFPGSSTLSGLCLHSEVTYVI